MKFKLALLIIGILSFSCTSYMYYQIYQLRLGMDKANVFDVIESDEHDRSLFLINSFEEDLYNISKKVNESNISVLIVYKYFSDVTWNEDSYYYLAFQDDKLLYFGMPFELTRHSNELISKIGEEANQIVLKEYKEYDD